MTDTELDQATEALKGWFISQDISPPDAGVIMTFLIASLFVQKTRDVSELAAGITSQAKFLALEVAKELSR